MSTATRTPQLGRIRLSDQPDGDGFHRSWVQILPEGRYEHPEFGDIDLTRPALDEMIRNFHEKARGIDIALDYDHKAKQGDSKAPGWIENLQYRPALGTTPAGLWAHVRWTSIGLADVKGQLYRYLSAEFHPQYHNDITGKDYTNVLLGVTLTNRPYMKHMPAIALSQRGTFQQPGHYTQGDRKKIAASDFAGPGQTFPIVTQQDVHDAARLLGHAANPATVKARITAIAKRKGFSLPTEWEAEDSGGGGKGMSEVHDLNDMSLYEDEAESARYELADSSSKASKKGKGKNAPTPDDENAAEDEQENGEEFDGEDAAAMDDDGGDEYAEEDADGADDDIDHLPANQKAAGKAKGKGGKGGSKQMSEYGGAVTLAEANARIAELERKFYLKDAEVVLHGFESGTFQFTATEARVVSKKTGQPLNGTTVKRIGNYKLSPKALKAVREWYMSESAYTLAEGERNAVLALVETVAAGVVDLSVRGSSHDMERQKTVTLKSPSLRAVGKAADHDVALVEAATELASSRGDDFDLLRRLQAQQSREGIEASRKVQQYYALAERQLTAD